MKKPPSLRQITTRLDKAWSSRNRADGTVGKLLYEAQLIYSRPKAGRPKNGESSGFSGYVKERGIPLSTAKDLINRHRIFLGEIPAPKAKPEPEYDPELDGTAQLESASQPADKETLLMIDERSPADKKDYAIWRDSYDRTRDMENSEFDEWFSELYLTVENRRGHRHGQTLTISGKPHQTRFHPDGSLKKTVIVSEEEAA
jgi:hypothetical protein